MKTENKPNMGFLVFQICFVDYGNQCSMSISSASEPESSLMNLTGSDFISAFSFRFTATEIPAKWRGGGGGGGGRLFEGGDYFKYFGQRGAIIRGRGLIEGRLLFEELRYVHNLRKKGSAHPKINTERFMNTFVNRLIFKLHLL